MGPDGNLLESSYSELRVWAEDTDREIGSLFSIPVMGNLVVPSIEVLVARSSVVAKTDLETVMVGTTDVVVVMAFAVVVLVARLTSDPVGLAVLLSLAV